MWIYGTQDVENENELRDIPNNVTFIALENLDYIQLMANKTDQQIVLNDQRKLGYAEYGVSSGYPIIYCHGSQSSRLEMHYDLSFALQNDLRILTIDRPGHGLSDHNPKGDILSFANDVRELTIQLGLDRYSVAGMSAGAPFALGLAYSMPEKINKVAIISGFAPYTADSKQYLTKEVRVMLGLAKSFPFLLRLLLKVQSKQLMKNPQKALANFLKIMSEPDQEILKKDSVLNIIEAMFKEAFKNGSNGVAHEITKILVRDWGFHMQDIKVPVTFWQGMKDTNVPYQWAELMHDKIENATINRFEDEGHLIIFQHAQEIFKDLV